MLLPRLLLAVRLALVLGFIAGPVVFANQQQKQMRNFRVVSEGVLYRSGQMTPEGLRRAIHDYGIRTVVTLRDAKETGATPPDAAEEAFCRAQAIQYVRIGTLSWQDEEGKAAPVQKGVDQFLKVMSEPKNHPVLIHCYAGTHRTGGYCAVYRMEFDGWSNEQALEELKANGYAHIEEEKDIFGYLNQYRAKKPE